MESNRLLCAVITWLAVLAMCWPANAQKNLVTSIDYHYELTLYRPRIAITANGEHAVAWESLTRLIDTEEWQIGVQTFRSDGSPIDEAIYLRDPISCVEEGIEGYRGVQNADLKITPNGELLIAMEPAIDMFEGQLHKQPRTILSILDQNSTVAFEESRAPCNVSSKDNSTSFDAERPRFDLLPQTGEIVLVNSSEADFETKRKNPFRKISTGGRSALQDKRAFSPLTNRLQESWYDVAVGHLFTAYSWQRCYLEGQDDVAHDCDVVVQFVPHNSHADVVHTAKPIRVNAADEQGVLNYMPSIAMNSIGESVVVWIDYRFSEEGDIFAQRFDSSGWPLGENKRISDGSGVIDDTDGLGPEVAINDDGSYMVVWTQEGLEGRRAYGRVIADDNTGEASFMLDQGDQIESSGADVASNGVQFAYTWLSEDEFGPNVYYWVTGAEAFTSSKIETPRTRFSFTGYPNPFSEETTLEYELFKEGHVTLVIYDLLGREVKKLIDKWQGPGSYLVNVPASELAIGYYVTKLQQGDLQFSKVLIRTP